MIFVGHLSSVMLLLMDWCLDGIVSTYFTHRILQDDVYVLTIRQYGPFINGPNPPINLMATIIFYNNYLIYTELLRNTALWSNTDKPKNRALIE